MSATVDWAAVIWLSAAMFADWGLGLLVFLSARRAARQLRTRLAWRRHWRTYPYYEPDHWEQRTRR